MKHSVMRLIMFLSALLSAQAVMAGGAKPPDVPAYVPITPTYASGVTLNVAASGTLPMHGIIANIPTAVSTTEFLGTDPSYTTGGEDKVRFSARATHTAPVDPIRNYGEYGTTHDHLFFGNMAANGWSTYASLRDEPTSKTMGGPINNSAYWIPCSIKTNPFGDGKNYCVKIDTAIIYYNGSAENNEVYMPNGMRFVFGTHMDDPDDLLAQAEIALANAQPGTAGRYEYLDQGDVKWICNSTGETKAFLATSGGADPFTVTCPSSSLLVAQIGSPKCSDTVNLWSPDGYSHVRYKVWDNVANKEVCPDGWAPIFTIALLLEYTHSGAADYTTWRLSSDNAAATAAGHSMRNGESLHADYVLAWDEPFLRQAEDFCIGANGATAGNECNSSTISATQSLKNVAILGTVSYGTATAGDMFQVGTASLSGSRDHATH